MSQREHFDAIVVGSGFGGSVMTYRLAEAGLRVCLLERGKRYPPGSFARSPNEIRANFWDPSEGRQGLFQIWNFGGIDGVVSAGLGGGSLIYANVLLRKDERWFYRRHPDGNPEEWPVTRSDLDPHYDRVESMLTPQRFPFDREPYSQTSKTRAFREAATAADLEWFLPNLAVTFGDPVDRPVPGEPIRDSNGGYDGQLARTHSIHVSTLRRVRRGLQLRLKKHPGLQLPHSGQQPGRRPARPMRSQETSRPRGRWLCRGLRGPPTRRRG